MPKILIALSLALSLGMSLLGASPSYATVDPASMETQQFDVVIYGTTTAGIGTLRGLQMAAARYPKRLRVAVVSSGSTIESPLAQGLGVEDMYGSDHATGFYLEFRNGIIDYYNQRGVSPFGDRGRLVYETQASRDVLGWFLDRDGQGRPNVSLFYGRLKEARCSDGERYVVVQNGGRLVRLLARYLVDASPEGDLGRLAGAGYMIGKSETVYNDVTNPPPLPTSANDWTTAPQSLSILLTLQVVDGTAPRIASVDHPTYDPASYAAATPLSSRTRNAFATSWSMTNILPFGKRELNESWSDYTNSVTSFEWTMYPEKRAQIRATIQSWVLNRIRNLQENGYPNVGVETVPTRPYVREGVRFLGLSTYTGEQVASAAVYHSITHGRYARFDRHDPFYGSTQEEIPTEVFVPMETLMPQGFRWMLTPTAISADYRAYSSAVRMEPVRANMGGAAGIIIAIANAQAIAPHEVAYADVLAELERQGYEVE